MTLEPKHPKTEMHRKFPPLEREPVRDYQEVREPGRSLCPWNGTEEASEEGVRLLRSTPKPSSFPLPFSPGELQPQHNRFPIFAQGQPVPMEF